MSDESTYLAWSKTIEGISFRAFAFTEGCDDPECDACQLLDEAPVWAVFMRPREERDEWCLSLLAYGNFHGEFDRLETIVSKTTGFEDEEAMDRCWHKLAALIGEPWEVVSSVPYDIAVLQKDAADEFLGGHTLLSSIFRSATEDELREVRKSRESGESFGQTVGKLWWTLIKRAARRNRGS